MRTNSRTRVASDLTEYSVPPDQPTDEDERQTQPFQPLLDLDDDLDAPVHLDSFPRPVSDQWVPVSIHNHDTFTPMPTTTQHDNVPFVHPSMYVYPVPCNDNHPSTNNTSQRALQRPPVSSPPPGTPGSHRTPPSGDRRTQQDAGASAQGSPAWNKRPRSTSKPGPSGLNHSLSSPQGRALLAQRQHLGARLPPATAPPKPSRPRQPDPHGRRELERERNQQEAAGRRHHQEL